MESEREGKRKRETLAKRAARWRDRGRNSDQRHADAETDAQGSGCVCGRERPQESREGKGRLAQKSMCERQREIDRQSDRQSDRQIGRRKG